MEVNPEDVSPAGLSAWKDLGVSYLSLGVQSFDARSLEFLGRHHTPGQAQGVGRDGDGCWVRYGIYRPDLLLTKPNPGSRGGPTSRVRSRPNPTTFPVIS